jgi:hypothetical protein
MPHDEETLMKYALLIYGTEDEKSLSEAEIAEMYAGHEKFGNELGALGKIHGGEELQPSATAAVVRVRGGEMLATDGPFMETKEQLGGFYVIEADDLEDAKRWAAKIPATATTAIEVRPLVDHSSGN